MKPSLDAIRFDTNGYEYQGEPNPSKLRVWSTPDGDGLGLYFFSQPPDLPDDIKSVAQLREFYNRVLGGAGVQFVETGVCRAAGKVAVRVIFKTPQQPSGLTYVGSLTVPFRDFSFVVKVQCEERGITGIREAVLLNRRLASGEEPTFTEGRMELPDWHPDAEEFDAEFPEHPISRARRVLRHVAGALVVEPVVAQLPGFSLPCVDKQGPP